LKKWHVRQATQLPGVFAIAIALEAQLQMKELAD
jgi:hypothetical protein